MKIAPQTYETVANQIISVVSQSGSPLGIGQTLELVQKASNDLQSDVVVALVWHLLANHRLEFSGMRKLTVPSEHANLQAS